MTDLKSACSTWTILSVTKLNEQKSEISEIYSREVRVTSTVGYSGLECIKHIPVSGCVSSFYIWIF